MRMLHKFIFASLLIAMASASAMACDCVTGSVAESFAAADVVFEGTVLHIDPTTGQTIFQVRRWLKGGSGEDVALSSEYSDCGHRFAEGFTYYVYARRFEGALRSGMCSGTRVIGEPNYYRGASFRCATITNDPSYIEIAAVTGMCVSLSLGLGMAVEGFKRRFRK